MASLKQMDARVLVKILKSYGAVEEKRKGKGSHAVFVRMDPAGKKRSTVVPLGHKVIAKGTLAAIRRQLGLSASDGHSNDDFLGRA